MFELVSYCYEYVKNENYFIQRVPKLSAKNVT
jgi:hypothetical protein